MGNEHEQNTPVTLDLSRPMPIDAIAAEIIGILPRIDAPTDDVTINWGRIPDGPRIQTIDAVVLLNTLATRIGVDNPDRAAVFAELRVALGVQGIDVEALDPVVNTDIYSPTAPHITSLPPTNNTRTDREL